MTGLGSKRASFESLDKMNANAALYLKKAVVGTTSACLYHATYSCVCVELNAPDSWIRQAFLFCSGGIDRLTFRWPQTGRQ